MKRLTYPCPSSLTPTSWHYCSLLFFTCLSINQNELFAITHTPHEVSHLFSPFCYSIPLELSPHNSSLHFYILLFSQGPVQMLPPMHILPCFSTIILYALKKLFTEIKASSAPIWRLPLQRIILSKSQLHFSFFSSHSNGSLLRPPYSVPENGSKLLPLPLPKPCPWWTKYWHYNMPGLPSIVV